MEKLARSYFFMGEVRAQKAAISLALFYLNNNRDGRGYKLFQEFFLSVISLAWLGRD